MKHTIVSLFIFLLSSYPAQGMWFKAQLSEMEKLIFLHKVNELGREAILNIIEKPTKSKKNTKNNEDIKNNEEIPCLIITTKIRKDQTDELATFIMNLIQQQETKYGYVPEQKSEKQDDVWHITMPTNYLGNYTCYWHKVDNKGEYIELHSTFTYKPSLMEILNNY